MDTEILRLLEERIEGVLSRHAEAVQERDRLRDELGQAQARIDQLAAQLLEQERERAQVKAHVERIMSRLDGLHLE